VIKTNINLDINKSGFNIFDNNIFDLDKNKINSDFDIYFKNPLFRENGYENIAILKLENFKNTLFSKVLFDIEKVFSGNNLKYEFETLWLQNSNHSFTESKINELPFIPHIDKKRYLKVMIYLNDIKESSGPINLTKINPEKFENLRKNLETDYKLKKKNVIQSIPIKDYISCAGNFGTTIIFDTNTPHFAGKITEKNTCRKILRFNFVKKKKYFFNQKFLINLKKFFHIKN